MKILIYSPAFHPSIGGLETLVSILAHEFVHDGHQVKLISQTPAHEADSFPFEVIRRPGSLRLLNLVRWCDIYFQPNISLRGVWPLALTLKPWIVAHNNWYSRADGHLAWQDRVKHFLIQFATGISVSHSVAAHVKTPSTIIPNAYSENVFRLMPEIKRERELVFLGRLVSDKGVDLVLEALSILRMRGLSPQLTIIGGGPEEGALRQQAEELRLTGQVEFAGIKTGEELTRFLNAHQILVVPSRWREPFGIVALEAIACGCVVVGSEGGGLKDAIGVCGETFPNGDAQALARVLEGLLTDDTRVQKWRAGRSAHLARHMRAKVAREYLDVFETAARGRRRFVTDRALESSKP